MRKEEIVAIAVRLFAIFIGVYTLRYASSLAPSLRPDSPNSISWLFFFLFTVPPILIAILLWHFPMTVANKLLPKVKASESIAHLSVGEIQTAAFSILGMWVLSSALPHLFYWVVGAYQIKTASGIMSELMPVLTQTIAELIIGLWLLLGAEGLVGVLKRFREAGTHT